MNAGYKNVISISVYKEKTNLHHIHMGKHPLFYPLQQVRCYFKTTNKEKECTEKNLEIDHSILCLKALWY